MHEWVLKLGCLKLVGFLLTWTSHKYPTNVSRHSSRRFWVPASSDSYLFLHFEQVFNGVALLLPNDSPVGRSRGTLPKSLETLSFGAVSSIKVYEVRKSGRIKKSKLWWFVCDCCVYCLVFSPLHWLNLVESRTEGHSYGLFPYKKPGTSSFQCEWYHALPCFVGKCASNL